MKNKLLSVLVVSLFIASAFCVMTAVPVESETNTQNKFIFTRETNDSGFSDNPLPKPVDDVADFTSTGDPTKALEALNKYLPETAEPCSWNAETRTLTLSQIDFNTTCKNEKSGLGAAIVLPEDSTVDLIAGCRISVEVPSYSHTQIFGLYCNGNLHFNTNHYTVEFVLTELTGDIAVEKFSAGLYVAGELTLSGYQTGRLAVSSQVNKCSPVIGVYAGEGFNVKNSEILITANIGECLDSTWKFGKYCTIGLYSPSITIDCMDCQEISIKGGLINTFVNGAKSCGIVTEKMEVKHGKVIALGGNHFEVHTSIGIEFIGEESSLTGNGTVSAAGGNAGVQSIGIHTADSNLTIGIRELNLSGAFSGDGILGMYTDNLKIDSTTLNIGVLDIGGVKNTNGIRCRLLEAVNCDINIIVMGCTHSWCILSKECKFTGCNIYAEVLNNPYDTITTGSGMVSEQMEFRNCDVYVKTSNSRFTSEGLNVESGPEGKGWIIIDNSKVHVETGNNVGVGVVECIGITAYNLKVTHSELSVMAGNSNFSIGLRMNGGEAIIENSKVTANGGDLISFSGVNSDGSTFGFQTNNDLTITNSEVCFTGGKIPKNGGISIGLDLTSKEREQSIKITNSRFDADGETMALRADNPDICKISCPELYGLNKQTGHYEKFDIKNIDNYTDIATSNWIEDIKTEPSNILAVVILVLLVAIFVTGLAMYWHNRS